MTILKRSLAMLVTILMMVSVFAACSNKEETKTDATEKATVVETVEETTTADDSNDASTITEDEAIELVKQEMGEDYNYIPADELEEKDGSQYYVIYVKKLLDTGTLTTMATYLVKTDGSEYFDKDAATAYFGEYVNSGSTGETTFTVSEDGTFEMTTVGDVNQTVLGTYKLGVTDSANVVSLKLYPSKSIVEDNGEEVEEEITDREGSAVIENGELTLSMESQDTVFIKK